MNEEGIELTNLNPEKQDSIRTKEVIPARKKEEVKSNVIDGIDEEGALLRGLIVDSIKFGSESLGPISETFEKAQISAKNIDKAGEANILYQYLKTLYEQADLGEYEIEIEGDSVERSKKVKKKLSQDLTNLPDKAADYFMKDYYDQKAKLDIHGSKLEDEIKLDKTSRRRVRIAAYRQEREEDKLLQIENAMLSKLGRRDRLADLLEPRIERRIAVPESYQKLENIDDNEKLVAQRIESYTQELKEGGGKGISEAFAGLSREIKEKSITQLLDTELRERHLKSGLKIIINGGVADTTCEQANKIEENNLQKKSIKAEIDVAIANQRFVESIRNFDEARVKLGKKLGKIKDPRAEIEKTIRSYIDIISSAKGVSDAVIKKQIQPYLDKLSTRLESASDLSSKFLIKVDKVYDKTGRRFIRGARTILSGIKDRARGEYTNLTSSVEIKKLELRRWYYTKRHDLTTNRKRRIFLISAEILTAKKKAGIVLERLVSAGAITKEEGAELRKKHEKVGKLKVELAKRRGETFKNIGERNPYFKKLDDELEDHIAEITTIDEPKEDKKEIVIFDKPQKPKEKPKVAKSALITPPPKEKDQVEREPEVLEEEREKKKRRGARTFTRFNKNLKHGRQNVEDARESLAAISKLPKEEGRLKGKESVKFRKQKYERLGTIALNEYANALFRFNNHLNARIKTRGVNESKNTFDRYIKLDRELSELHNRYIQQFEDVTLQVPTGMFEERESILKKYDEKFKERLRVHLIIAKQRGQ